MGAEAPTPVARTGEARWWLEGRRRIVARALRRHLAPGHHRVFVAGANAAAMTDVLGQFGTVRQGDIPGDLRESGDVDVVAAFDVLERFPDDGAVLREVHRTLPPGGVLVVTVAAFEFLWGPYDELREHRRRYSREELRQRLEGAGFFADLVSYFGAWLFPAVSARAVVRRFRGWTDPRPDFISRSTALDRALTWVAVSEAPLIGRWSPPVGVSLVAVAHKP